MKEMYSEYNGYDVVMTMDVRAWQVRDPARGVIIAELKTLAECNQFIDALVLAEHGSV